MCWGVGEGMGKVNLVLDGLVAAGWGQVLSHCFWRRFVFEMLEGL